MYKTSWKDPNTCIIFFGQKIHVAYRDKLKF